MFTGPQIVKNGLKILLDDNNIKSYSGTGGTWTNLIIKESYYGNFVPDMSFANNTSQITICIVLKKIYSTVNNYAWHPINKWNGGYNVNSSFILYQFDDYYGNGNDGLLAWYGYTTGNGWSQLTGGGNQYRMVPGEVAYVCLQFNTSNNGGQMWVNGQKIGGRSGSTGNIGPNTAGHSNIGIYGPEQNGPLKILKAFFYNRELSDSEMIQNYNAVKSKIIKP